MTKTTQKLKVILASLYAFELKAKHFHWNVEGPAFVQYHLLFDQIASDIGSTLDRCAEYIRAGGEYAPASFSRYTELSVIKDEVAIPNSVRMLTIIRDDCSTMIASVIELFKVSSSENEQGVANFSAELQDKFSKWKWQLNSCIPKSVGPLRQYKD